MVKLREVQEYLEKENLPYQVEIHWEDTHTKEFGLGLLDKFIKEEHMKNLINNFNMSLQDGFIWGVFEK